MWNRQAPQRVLCSFVWLGSLVWLCAVAGCAALPAQTERPDSVHGYDETTTLARMTSAAGTGRVDVSGVRILDSGYDAFLERTALIEAAEKTIDAQYYIWNSDLTGRYLAERVYAAAERGVRVRLLLDDINVAGRDATLVALDAHRNIELRIYNPFAERAGARKVVGLMREFARLNRRMHNKSFTVDGAVAIVGGRNIGDEYFDANPHLNFLDRDVVAIGPVVDHVGDMFDTFWNSALSYEVSSLTQKRLSPEQVAALYQTAGLAAGELERLAYSLPVGKEQARRVNAASFSKMTWAPARLVFDTPPDQQRFGDTDAAQSTARAMAELARAAKEEILIESAYLVLDDSSVDTIQAVRNRGVAVRAVTNSLSSNDVTANHAAYARRRRQMLDGGIDLYELRIDAASCGEIVVIGGGCSGRRILGLHAKSYVFDRSTVSIGSLNLNLRSAYLNAETVMIIESRELAASLAAGIEKTMQPENSWHVVRDAGGRLVWQTRRAEQTVTRTSEPDTSWWRRTKSATLALLPLEKYF